MRLTYYENQTKSRRMPTDDRSEKLTTPMTPDEYLDVRIRAAKQGMSMAEYSRRVLAYFASQELTLPAEAEPVAVPSAA